MLKSYLHFCGYQYHSGKKPFRSYVKWILNDFQCFILKGSIFLRFPCCLWWTAVTSQKPHSFTVLEDFIDTLPCSPYTLMHADAYALTQVSSRPYIASHPSALLLSAVVLSRNPDDPLWQSSQRLWDKINSNSCLSSPFICFLFRPLSLPPSLLSPWLRSHSVIFQHRGPKKFQGSAFTLRSDPQPFSAPLLGRHWFRLSLKCWRTGINREVSVFEALQDKHMASWETGPTCLDV